MRARTSMLSGTSPERCGAQNVLFLWLTRRVRGEGVCAGTQAVRRPGRDTSVSLSKQSWNKLILGCWPMRNPPGKRVLARYGNHGCDAPGATFLTSIQRWSLMAAWRFSGIEPCAAARSAARVGLGKMAPRRKLVLGFPPSLREEIVQFTTIIVLIIVIVRRSLRVLV
jgi:hypothetical protein